MGLRTEYREMDRMAVAIDGDINSLLEKVRIHRLKIKKFMSLQDKDSNLARKLLEDIDIEHGMPPARMEMDRLEKDLYDRLDDFDAKIKKVDKVVKAYDDRGQSRKQKRRLEALQLLAHAMAVSDRLREMKRLNQYNA